MKTLWMLLGVSILAGCPAQVGSGARETCEEFIMAIDRRERECGHDPKVVDENTKANLDRCSNVVDVKSTEKVFSECIPQVERTTCKYESYAVNACEEFGSW